MSEKSKKPPSKIDAYIDQNLKQVFATVETEDIPDRFKELLERLRAQDQDSRSDT